MKQTIIVEAQILKNDGTPFPINSDDIFRRIKNGNDILIPKINKIRNNNISQDEKDGIIDSLPIINFNEKLRYESKVSEFITFDFRGFPDDTTMTETKTFIAQKPYVFMCFDSADGKGLKVVVRTPVSELFKENKLFEALEKDMNSKYLDASKKSKSFRESYDPNIHINQYCREFVVSDTKPKAEIKADDPETDKKKTPPISEFVNPWKSEFTERIKKEVKSKKQNFHFGDALKRSEGLRTGFDTVMIDYLKFMRSNPLENNDYFKYVNSYRQGKKLDEKYFRHDLEKLHKYYKKVDKDPTYNPFSESGYKRYVLYMMLKLKCQYLPEFDEVFRVIPVDSRTDKPDHRETNPATNIASVLRAVLPFRIKEYDIFRAYPTFIFMQLGMKPFDVYKRIDKQLFNMLLNTHKGVKGATIESVRDQLRPIYGDRVDEVITEKRFNTSGGLYYELTAIERKYVEKFVDANHIKNSYVRLHDGVIVHENTDCVQVVFDDVVFEVKEFEKPDLESEITTFYEIDQEGKVITNPVLYSNFFQQENFIRITREGHDKLTILKNESKIVTPINNKTDLVPYLKANINELNTSRIENRIARDATSVIQQGLQLLIPIPLEYHRDTKTTCDIPFKNGIARIKADSMELVSYDEINGFFAKHTTQQHEISFTEEVNSDFYDFLKMAAINKDAKDSTLQGDDGKVISAFCSMFGYLITNYKNPAFNPAIILSDDDADGETRNGGRGKSLVQKALSYFRPSIEKGGNAYDPKYTHVHADLKLEHDLYLIDDVPSNFDYNALYTHITGAIDAQRKGVTAETIPFEDAPKFVISTNWAVRYDAEATSTNRRFKEYKFSKFWNINNTPDKYFGKSFFNDWDQNEWNAFYNFGFFCVQHYLKNGLQTIEYDKKADNFRAYFYNDSILEETKRILENLEDQPSFSVTDFVRIHQSNELFKYKPEFTLRNARKYIDSFIEFEGLPYSYSQRVRKWRKV